MIRVKIMILSAVLCCFGSVAQNRTIDSLIKIVSSAKEDTNKVNLLLSVAISSVNKDTSFIFINKAMHLSEKLNWILGSIEANNIKAVTLFNESDFDGSIKYYFQSLKLSLKNNELKKIHIIYNGIGSSYLYKGDYPKALDFFFKTLKIAEQKNNKEYIAMSYMNIANVFMIQNEREKSFDYNFKALQIAEDIKKDVLKEKVCYTIGSNYGAGTLHGGKSDHLKAISWFNKSLELNKKMNNKSGLAYVYNAIGSCYENLNQHNEAILNFQKSTNIAIEIGDKRVEVANISTMAYVYNSIKKYPRAIENYINVIKISKEIDSKDVELDALIQLTGIYKVLNQSDNALRTYENYIALRDTILSQENGKEIVKKEMNYEFDKKEAELKAKAEAQKIIATEEKKRQQLIIYSVASVLLLVIIFSLFLYNRFAITRKQNVIIEKQKFIVEQKNHLIVEKHKEITDSINYAERIQRSLLASKQLLDENLKEYFVLFKPKDVVSGDFYWASKLSDNNFVLVAADSTGHGVPGAIMSMLNMNSLKEAVTKGFTKADDILNYTRTIIIDTLANDGSIDGGKDGMDCSLMIFDFNTLCLSWVAANNPIWIVRSLEVNKIDKQTELIELKPQKMPVGKHDKQHEPFINQTFQLQKNDVVFTITDGYPDQFGGLNGKKFMSKNLKELLLANANIPLQKQREILEQVFENWAGDLEQVDDVTIIGIKI